LIKGERGKGEMLKRLVTMLVMVVSLVSLQGCVSVGGVEGLNKFVDALDGYQFLYPNGWLEVKVSNASGADVVFHDIIEQAENVSVVINPLSAGSKKLEDLGSPGEVGYKLGKSAIAPPGSGREAELVSAEAREVGDKTYYLLEYIVKIGDRTRHNIAEVAASRGKLYTINASTAEDRWEKMKDILERSIKSFSVY
jgi:photosystem II oxygen-evolving enhancer protein 2